MYRIRTAAGTETNYSSLEEFTVAVRRGEVHPEDEIFHTRANRWLDVKSHPHYRSALDGHTPAPAAPTASPAAPSHTQLRPALSASPAPQSPAPRPGHAPSPAAAPQARAQVFERPAAAAPRQVAQTQVHPQLQPQAAARSEAPAPAPYRPAKSKELTFVDTGVAPTVGRPNLPAVELAPPPMQKTELKPAAKPAPIAKSTGNEMDFLIMDGGIESPVRTSAGHKTIPEEFGLLFDQQSVEPQAPDTPTGGKKAAAGARSGKQQAIVIPPDTAAAVSSPAAQPAPAAPAPHAEQATDAPAAAPAPDMTSESTWSTGARTNYLGGGIALLVIVGGLLAWKPWKAGGDDTAPPPIAAQSAEPVTSDPDPSSLITPASASTPPIGSLDGAGAAIPPATRPGTGKEATEVPVDSAKPEVVVAARPDFGGGGVPVSGDISIGTDVGTRGSANAVAPSELVRRLAAAQKDAQLDLNGRLATLGFRGVINPARLGTPALVAAARTAWTGGVDAIRSYRARIARTEKAYEDSVLTSQRSQKWPGDEMRAWAGRQSLAEPSDASQLTDLMFTQVSEGLEILSSMPGDYTIKGDKISFKEAAGATRYASIRGWVEQRMATWASTPESARPYSVSATLRALGDGFPAVE